MESPHEPIDDVPPPQRRPWSRRRKIFTALLVLLGFAAMALWAFNRAGSVRRTSEIEAVRAAGRPVTFEELQAKRTKIPDAENSALLIVPMFDELEQRAGSASMPVYGFGSDWADLGERLSPEMMGVVGSYLEERQDLLAKLHDAATLKQGAYPVQWAPDGISTLLPHLSKVRTVTRLLCLEALYRANRGDMDGAMDSSLAALRVGASVGDEPFIISMLVRIACEAVALDALQRVLALGRPSEEWIERFRSELLPLADEKELLVAALDGERVLMLSFLAEARQGRTSLASAGAGTPGAPGPTIETIILRVFPGYIDMNEAQYLRRTRPFWEAAGLPLRDYMRELQAVDNAIPSISSFYVFVKALMPSLGRASQLFAMNRLQIRAAIVALDAETFHRRQGHWPAKLDDLVRDPDLPARMLADMFDDDKPMKYKVDAAGCVIYSVAEDGTDDGGEFKKAKSGGKGDIGFRLISPGRRGARTTTRPIDEKDLEQIEKLRAETQPAADSTGGSPGR